MPPTVPLRENSNVVMIFFSCCLKTSSHCKECTKSKLETKIDTFLFCLLSVLVQSGRKSDSQRRNTDQSQAGLGLVTLSDLQSMAREEGEGMETTETESLSPAITPLTSLEHLLMSPDPKQGTVERRALDCHLISLCLVYH